MTRVAYSGSKEHFTGDYADPSICYYYSYMCAYCEKVFQVVEPDNNFQAGGAVRLIQYRNKFTNELVVENRVEGVCLDCCKEIARRQQETN
jgi:hypothetical protein